MFKSQIPLILSKLQRYVEQGYRIKLDGKVIAGGVGLTAGLYGDILREVEARAAAKWKNAEKKITTTDWKTLEVFYYVPNGRCVGRWVRSSSFTIED